MLNNDILQYFSICCVLPFSITVNKTLYQEVKNEEHEEKGKIVQRIIKMYSIVNSVFLPFLILCVGLLYVSIEYLEILELETT